MKQSTYIFVLKNGDTLRYYTNGERSAVILFLAEMNSIGLNTNEFRYFYDKEYPDVRLTFTNDIKINTDAK